MNKICTICGRVLPATKEFFYKKVDHRDGLYNQCKKCIIDRARKNRRDNLKKRIKYDHEYYKKNREKTQKRLSKAVKKRNKVTMEKLGISYSTIHWRMKKIIKKPKYCVICNNKKKLHLCCIDHEYSMDKGKWIWLCTGCHHLFDYCRKHIRMGV